MVENYRLVVLANCRGIECVVSAVVQAPTAGQAIRDIQYRFNVLEILECYEQESLTPTP